MSRAEVLTELRETCARLPDRWLAVVLYAARRLDSGERVDSGRDGIHTATQFAGHACDIAVDRIAALLEHGADAVWSPAGGIQPGQRS